MLRSWGQFPAIFAASRSARRCSIVASTLVDQLSILVSWLLDMLCTFIHQQKHSTKAEQNQLQIKGHRSLGTGGGGNCEDCFRHCLRANCIWCTCVWQNVVTAEQPATPSTVASASSWRLQPGAKQLHFDLCVLHKIPNLDSVAMLPNVAPCCRLLTIIGNTINYGLENVAPVFQPKMPAVIQVNICAMICACHPSHLTWQTPPNRVSHDFSGDINLAPSQKVEFHDQKIGT